MLRLNAININTKTGAEYFSHFEWVFGSQRHHSLIIIQWMLTSTVNLRGPLTQPHNYQWRQSDRQPTTSRRSAPNWIQYSNYSVSSSLGERSAFRINCNQLPLLYKIRKYGDIYFPIIHSTFALFDVHSGITKRKTLIKHLIEIAIICNKNGDEYHHQKWKINIRLRSLNTKEAVMSPIIAEVIYISPMLIMPE